LPHSRCVRGCGGPYGRGSPRARLPVLSLDRDRRVLFCVLTVRLRSKSLPNSRVRGGVTRCVVPGLPCRERESPTTRTIRLPRHRKCMRELRGTSPVQGVSDECFADGASLTRVARGWCR